MKIQAKMNVERWKEPNIQKETTTRHWNWIHYPPTGLLLWNNNKFQWNMSFPLTHSFLTRQNIFKNKKREKKERKLRPTKIVHYITTIQRRRGCSIIGKYIWKFGWMFELNESCRSTSCLSFFGSSVFLSLL